MHAERPPAKPRDGAKSRDSARIVRYSPGTLRTITSLRTARPGLRRRLATGVAIALAVTVTACGDDAPGTSTSVAAPTAERGRYVALGDSFASGTGAGRIYGPSCQRSRSAYPWLLAKGLDLRDGFVDAACAGASTTDVLGNQLDFLTGRTRYVTLTVGGNDVQALTVVNACFRATAAACRSQTRRALQALPRLTQQLDALLASIRLRAPDARVVVAGYPRLFSGRRCRALPGLGAASQRHLNAMTDQLNATLRSRVRAEEATFVDPTAAFRGHGACASDPWINGVDVPGGLHPNADGHARGYQPLLRRALGR